MLTLWLQTKSSVINTNLQNFFIEIHLLFVSDPECVTNKFGYLFQRFIIVFFLFTFFLSALHCGRLLSDRHYWYLQLANRNDTSNFRLLSIRKRNADRRISLLHFTRRFKRNTIYKIGIVIYYKSRFCLLKLSAL